MKTKLLKKLRRQAIKGCSLEIRKNCIFFKPREGHTYVNLSQRNFLYTMSYRWHDVATEYIEKHKYKIKKSPYII